MVARRDELVVWESRDEERQICRVSERRTGSMGAGGLLPWQVQTEARQVQLAQPQRISAIGEKAPGSTGLAAC